MKIFKFAIVLLLATGVLIGIIYTNHYKANNNVTIDNTNEVSMVTEYVKSNISKITSEKPVLGGTWYVTDVQIDSENNTGNATFEDGHIQGKIIFKYTIDSATNNIVITVIE